MAREPGPGEARTFLRRALAWLRRRWLLWVAIAAFLALVISRRVEIGDLVATLRQGQWQWVLLCIALEALYYWLYAHLFRSAFAVVGVASRVPDLLPVLFASVFLNTLAPTAGLSGAALFVDDAVRRGQSGARATEGVLLETVAENLAVVPLLFAGLAYLLLRHVVQPFEIVGAAIFLLYVAGLAALLGVARWRAGALQRFLAGVQNAANRVLALIGRRRLLPQGWARVNAAAFRVAATAIIARPHAVAGTLAVALAQQLVNLAALEALFVAFQQPVGLGALVAGYSLGFVFAVILFIPFGVGVMQGIMVVIYDSLGVPAATAVVVVLAFGGLNAWLPVLLGVLFLQRLRPFGGGG